MTKQIGKNTLTVLGFGGSLRKGSYNKALLRAAVGLVPQDMNLEIFDLEGIPTFNQDTEQNMPEKVKDFKTKIMARPGQIRRKRQLTRQ